MISPATFDPTLDAPPASARLLRSLAVLSAVAGSSALAVQFVGMGVSRLSAFLTANTLSPRDRTLLIVTLGVGGIVPLILSGLALVIWRERAARVLDRLAGVAAIGVVAALLPALFCTPAWVKRPLNFLFLLTVTVVLVRVIGERSLVAASELGVFPRWLRVLGRPFTFVFGALDRRAVAITLVSVAGISYAVYTAYLDILNLHRLTMGSYDMGFFDSQMSNSLAGRFFRNTIMYGGGAGNSIAGHAHFAHIFFLPLYAIRPGSEFLLGLQAASVGLAAIPLFFFAATQVSVRASALLSLAFLLYAPLHGAQFYDFHWLLMASLFFFTICYAIVRDKRWLIPAPLLIMISLREDMSPGIAITGLFLMLTRAKPRMGLFLFIFGSVWFGIVKFVVMPAMGTWWFTDIYKDFIPPGEKGYGSIAQTLVTNPAFVFGSLLTETKLIYVLHLFAPLAFMPLRRPAIALLCLPGFLLTVLTTGYAAATSIYYQYPGHWIPYLFAGTVLALRVARTDHGLASARASLLAVLLGIVAHSASFGVVFQPRVFQGGGGKVAPSLTKVEAQRYANVSALVQQIPRKASVIATEWEVPLVTFHPDAFSASLHDVEPEYALIVKDHYVLNSKDRLTKMFKRRPYSLVAKKGDAYLFKRAPSSPATAQALRELGLE
jgi:uncharacterized membrane protein